MVTSLGFKLEFEGGDAAFCEAPREEVARILREVATAVDSGRDGGSVRDINGNRVGEWWLEIEDDEE